MLWEVVCLGRCASGDGNQERPSQRGSNPPPCPLLASLAVQGIDGVQPCPSVVLGRWAGRGRAQVWCRSCRIRAVPAMATRIPPLTAAISNARPREKSAAAPTYRTVTRSWFWTVSKMSRTRTSSPALVAAQAMPSRVTGVLCGSACSGGVAFGAW